MTITKEEIILIFFAIFIALFAYIMLGTGLDFGAACSNSTKNIDQVLCR